MKEAVIVSAVCTAVGKAPKGTLKNTRSDEMGAVAIKEAVARAGVDASLIDDVIMGCAFPEASQGMNVALETQRGDVMNSVSVEEVER